MNVEVTRTVENNQFVETFIYKYPTLNLELNSKLIKGYVDLWIDNDCNLKVIIPHDGSYDYECDNSKLKLFKTSTYVRTNHYPSSIYGYPDDITPIYSKNNEVVPYIINAYNYLMSGGKLEVRELTSNFSYADILI